MTNILFVQSWTLMFYICNIMVNAVKNPVFCNPPVTKPFQVFSTLQDWIQQKLDKGFSAHQVQYVRRKEEFDAVDPDNTEFLMGK